MTDLDFELMQALAHEPEKTLATPWVVVDRQQFRALVAEVERLREPSE